jgi:predicted NUDIX family NTP pyrophosphohydrolase
VPPVRSAGLLLYRGDGDDVEVLIGHIGGPFWAKRDAAAWSVPKGEIDEGEEPLAAARREFTEELGVAVPDGELLDLGEVWQSNRKIVTVWALRADLDPATVVPGTFSMEWPPGSGRQQAFPELDRVRWCSFDEARDLLLAGQRPFLDRLRAALSG